MQQGIEPSDRAQENRTADNAGQTEDDRADQMLAEGALRGETRRCFPTEDDEHDASGLPQYGNNYVMSGCVHAQRSRPEDDEWVGASILVATSKSGKSCEC